MIGNVPVVIEWFTQLLQHLDTHPALQGLLAAVCTLILEDPTTVGCGLLVADGQMHFQTAMLGLTAGVAVGDFTLYMMGRWIGPKTIRWRLVTPDRLERTRKWFDRNLIVTVLVARFVPGMRMPTYVGAGLFRASPIGFLGLALVASIIWTYLLLMLTTHLGRAILPMMGRYKWPAGVAILTGYICFQYWLARRNARRFGEESGHHDSPVSLFEFWPRWLFYIPVRFFYIWLALRWRGLTLPTAANPSLYSGGLIRESKSEIFGLVTSPAQRWVAPWTTLDIPGGVRIEALTRQALDALGQAELSLPVVAKPDVAHRGDGVQVIRSEEQLGRYLAEFPARQKVFLQRLVDLPNEAAILYYRFPGEERGQIFSLALKEFPRIAGDGRRTLRELILADDRAAIISEVYFRRHAALLGRVPAVGEEIALVFSGNHGQGAIFRNANHLVTETLRARIQAIADALPDFWFGRFDARFAELDGLLRGEGFQVVSIHGAGAEAMHIWDARTRLRGAYQTLFRQWSILFELGAINRDRGAKPMSFAEFWRAIRERREMRVHYPPTH